MGFSYETEIAGNPVVVINLTGPTIDCHVCGQPDLCQWGIPIWNGFIVANDWPGEWGGVSVCCECFARHERGELTEVPTSEYCPEMDEKDYGS